ncbi:MAG TPA: SDR family NAD(P)-dependent oxidoreductase [Planctomycetota bacterium]|nr:SDR family NAD(P)-dependent oxidoreductase [Planctomycetota bacterium]
MASALESKIIVIIGGTTGMGLSAAKACLAEGARIVAVGRSEENCRAAREALGDSARVLAGDATDPKTAPRAIEAAISDFGGFHGLYHVAGGSARKWGDGPLHEITDEGWEQALRINLTALFNSNRAAAQQFMKQRGGGTVLNMTSVLGMSPSIKFFATHGYAAAKSAVIGFTKSVAAYYAPHNIRFNAVAPSLVETPMAARACGNDEIRAFVERKQPLDGGRIGEASDLDAAVVYFLSDGSKFVTGQVLIVDGGWCVSETF